MKEWHTAAELAALKLPGLPSTESAMIRRAARDAWRSRPREGRGGGLEFHASALPAAAQVRLGALARKAAKAAEAEPAPVARDELWRWYDAQAEAKKAKARDRATVLDAVETLHRNGVPKDVAVMSVAARHGVSATTVYNWFGLVAGRDRADWLPALAPRHAGRTATVECDAEAWDFIKAAYLNDSEPPFADCYQRLERAAKARGWSYPSERTLFRRLTKTVHPAVVVLCRKGVEAAARMYPAQERDRSHFTALEAVNADGHTFDVAVRTPEGDRVVRPKLIGFQDLYSGMIVAWRLAETENSWAVRLTVGDMVETYGIPKKVWLDNGRAFASKWLTGGAPNRYRFIVREEDPVGILTQLIGPDGIHWTTPYRGQAKPIERAWRDLASDISRHPACAGAYLGPNPMEKPESYASRALAWADFEALVASEIHEHNDRRGRTSKVCAGRSFRETFAESYARNPVTRATEEQRRLWLLAAEGIQASKRDGSIRLMGNRYFAEFLHLHMGETLAVRFDPDFLHDGVHVHRMDGAYLGMAPVVEPAGFDSAEAARKHGQARKQWLRGVKLMKDAEVRMSAAQVAALIPPNLGPAAPPEAKVVQLARPVLDLKRAPAPELSAAQAERHEALIAEFRRPEAAPARDEKAERIAWAERIEAALAAGAEVAEGDRQKFARYARQPEWKAHKRLAEDFGGSVSALATA